MIGDHNQDDSVTHLKIFLLKWVENFNDTFTANFMLQKSALQINEKKIMQSMARRDREDSVNQGHENVNEEEGDLASSHSVSSNNDETQAEDSKGFDSVLQTPPKQVQLKTRFSEEVKAYEISNSKVKSFTIKTLNSRENSMTKIRTGENSLSDGEKTLSNASLRLPIITLSKSGASSPRPLGIRGTDSPKSKFAVCSVGPIHMNSLTTRDPRRQSLLRPSFQDATTISNSNQNLEKHYDSFFGEIADGSKESLKDEDSEQASSEVENEDQTLQEMIHKIQKLSSEGQDVLFRKLLDMQNARELAIAKLSD